MDAVDFARKFRLIERAAQRAGIKLFDTRIASDLFLPDGKGSAADLNAAKVRWSQSKRGWRAFNDDYLPSLGKALYRQGLSFFENGTENIFLNPYDKYTTLLVRGDLVSPRDLMDQPLAEKLYQTRTIPAAIELMRDNDHTFEWSQQFKKAFDQVPESQERLVALFVRTVQECVGRRGHIRPLKMAAGTLTYVWNALEEQSDFRKLRNEFEQSIHKFGPYMVLASEPFGYIATLHGHHGLFVRNIERIITDKQWRQADFEERLHYCGITSGRPAPTALARRVAVARNIERHLHAQGHRSEILCQDIGRVMEVYPTLIQYKRYRRLADFLKETTVRRLKQLGVSRTLINRARRTIEARPSLG